MRMMKRLAALLVAAMMMVSCASAHDAAMPHAAIVRLTVSAMHAAGEESLRIGGETALPASFVEQFFLLGREAGLGITDAVLADAAQQTQFINRVIACSGAETAAVAAGAQPGAGVDAVIMEEEMLWGQYNMDEDKAILCRGAVFQDGEPTGAEFVAVLRGSQEAPMGWKLEGLFLADMADTSFTETHILEHVNSTLGFSVLYPSAFLPDHLVASETDVTMQTEDGGATMRVSREPNTDGWTLESYAAALQHGELAYGQNDFAVWEIGHFEDGTSYLQIRSFTPEWDYTLLMTFDLAHTPEFTLYQDYVINSFSVEGSSVG